MLQNIPGEWAVYCEAPPEIEFRDDGMAHVVYRIGSHDFRVVLRPCTFFKSLADAGHKYNEWRSDQLDIVARLDDRRAGHAARS